MKIVLELTAAEYRALAGHLITAEGYAQKRERECRRLMLSMLTLEEKNKARQMARRAREDYKGAMKGAPTNPNGFVGRGRTNGVQRMSGKAGRSGTQFVLTTNKLYRAATQAEREEAGEA